GYLAIKYAANGVDFGSTLTTTASAVNGPQSFSWTIPSNIGTTNKIKIIDDDNTDSALNVSKESDAFEIKGQLQGTKPLNGDVYYIGGSPINIEWKYAGTLGNLDLFFSSDDGGSWGTAFATINAGYTQPYQYTVPDVPTTQGKIKLEQVSDRTYVNSTVPRDSAPNRFRIKGAVTIDGTHKPTSSTVWAVNADNNVVEWNITGSIATVAIDLDANSGNNSYNISVAPSVAAANRTYTWTIPSEKYVEVTSDLCRIRVRDASDPTVSDTSPADFKIKPVIKLNAPNNNTYQWAVGTRYNITWDPPLGSADSLKINVSTDGGTTWTDTDPPTLAAKGGLITSSVASAAGAFEWQVPDIMTNEGVVRIQKAGDVNVNDYSDSYFYIKGSISNVHIKNNPSDADPINPIDLPIDYVKYITWNYTGNLGTANVFYATDGDQPSPTWQAIPGGAGVSVGSNGSGSFAWTIPNTPSPSVKVKVANVHSNNWQDISGNTAYLNSIVGSITEVTVVSDANGTDMIVGGNKTIKWKPNGNITSFKIEYRYDGGSWVEITPTGGIAGSPSGDYRTWQWTGNPPASGIPDTISDDVDFRVSDYNDPLKVNAESGVNYIIKGSLNLTSPDGYETLTVAESFDVAWSKTGTIGNLKIEYSTDDFNADIRTIHSSWPSANSPYPWAPGITDITNQDNLKIRVSNITTITGTELTDKSQNPFKIIGKIYNVQPSGSSIIWNKGQTKNVTWQEDGNISAVDIKYKTAAGDPYNKTLALNHTGHSDGANAAEITVPDENSEDCWVQILDKNNSNVKGVSNAAFSIRPVITASSPLIDTNIIVASSNTDVVQWSLNGSAKVALVDVLYSTNGVGGPFDKTIAAGVDATLGKVNWNNVIDTMSNDVVVKVVDKTGGSGNPNVYGLSPSFDIIGSVTVQQPNSSANWVVGSTDKNITWTYTGSIGTVDIYYD
ncbi:MAG: hypothetical protein HZC16_00225, partial [Candidatus Omnitrophica bacterium]|nr:hypothetical protein [Candidatus Omnitrophota bacterium]